MLNSVAANLAAFMLNAYRGSGRIEVNPKTELVAKATKEQGKCPPGGGSEDRKPTQSEHRGSGRRVIKADGNVTTPQDFTNMLGGIGRRQRNA